MGKWLLCAEHPSNDFFCSFQNALIYTSAEDFSEKLKYSEVRFQGSLGCLNVTLGRCITAADLVCHVQKKRPAACTPAFSQQRASALHEQHLHHMLSIHCIGLLGDLHAFTVPSAYSVKAHTHCAGKQSQPTLI